VIESDSDGQGAPSKTASNLRQAGFGVPLHFLWNIRLDRIYRIV